MIKWALETLSQAVDDELSALGPIMQFLQDDLSEEALPGIYLQDMILFKFLGTQMCNLSDAYFIRCAYYIRRVLSDKCHIR